MTNHCRPSEQGASPPPMVGEVLPIRGGVLDAALPAYLVVFTQKIECTVDTLLISRMDSSRRKIVKKRTWLYTVKY